MAFRVRNRATGVEHDVPAGHPALTDILNFEVVNTEKPRESEGNKQEPAAKPKAKAKAKK